MPRFAANISTMFTDRPFAERIAGRGRRRLRGGRVPVPLRGRGRRAAARLADAGLELMLLNTPPGDFAAGERGLAGLPGREAEFRAALERALDYAQALGCPQIHVMAGVKPRGRREGGVPGGLQGQPQERGRSVRAAPGGLALIEPINTPRHSRATCSTRRPKAAALIAELGATEPQAAVRLLPRPDHDRRSRPQLRAPPADHRPCADRRRARASRARRRRDQLSLPVRSDRPAGLCRLGRLRVLSRRAAPRRASAGPTATASRPRARFSRPAASASERRKSRRWIAPDRPRQGNGLLAARTGPWPGRRRRYIARNFRVSGRGWHAQSRDPRSPDLRRRPARARPFGGSARRSRRRAPGSPARSSSASR